jgi:hypothetical protein
MSSIHLCLWSICTHGLNITVLFNFRSQKKIRPYILAKCYFRRLSLVNLVGYNYKAGDDLYSDHGQAQEFTLRFA